MSSTSFRTVKQNMSFDMMEILKKYLQERNELKLRELLESNPSILDETDANGSSGFMQIAYAFMPALFEMASALKKSFSFHEAIVAGRADLVTEYLSNEPELVKLFSPDGFPPLTLAAFFRQAEIASVLLDKGTDPNLQASNPSKVNALHSAVAREDIAISEMLIKKGIDVNARQVAGVTALHSAVHRGNLELVKLLVNNGADISLKMDDGTSALDFAEKDGHTEVKDYLLQLSAGKI